MRRSERVADLATAVAPEDAPDQPTLNVRRRPEPFASITRGHLERQTRRLTAALERSEAEVGTLTHEVSRLREEVAALEAVAQVAVVERDGARTQLSDSAEWHGKAEARAELAEEQVRRLTEEAARSRSEADAELLDQLTRREQALQARTLSLEADLQRSEGRGDELAASLAAELRRAAALEEEVERLGAAIQEASAKRSELEGIRDGLKATRMSLEGEVRAQSEKVEQLTSELSEASQRGEDLEKERVHLAVELEHRARRGDELVAHRASLEEDLERLRGTLRELESSQSSQVARASAAEEEAARLAAARDESIARAAALDAELAKLQKAQALHDETLANAASRIEAAERQAAAAISQLRKSQHLAVELAEARALIEQLTLANEEHAEFSEEASSALKAARAHLDRVTTAVARYASGEINEFGFIRSVTDAMRASADESAPASRI